MSFIGKDFCETLIFVEQLGRYEYAGAHSACRCWRLTGTCDDWGEGAASTATFSGAASRKKGIFGNISFC